MKFCNSAYWPECSGVVHSSFVSPASGQSLVTAKWLGGPRLLYPTLHACLHPPGWRLHHGHRGAVSTHDIQVKEAEA